MRLANHHDRRCEPRAWTIASTPARPRIDRGEEKKSSIIAAAHELDGSTNSHDSTIHPWSTRVVAPPALSFAYAGLPYA
jgi:hypothetical protein